MIEHKKRLRLRGSDKIKLKYVTVFGEMKGNGVVHDVNQDLLVTGADLF